MDSLSLTLNVVGCSQDGFRPLNLAAQNGHHECVALLLERGAQVDAAREVNIAGSRYHAAASITAPVHLHGAHPCLCACPPSGSSGCLEKVPEGDLEGGLIKGGDQI